MNTSTSASTITPPTPLDITEKLAVLNAALNAPMRADEPICVETIKRRVLVADECFMWFVGNRIALVRDKETNTYHVYV
jgi:hypothetical protein